MPVKKEITQLKKKLIISFLMVTAVLCFAGGTYAWFRYLQQLNTVSLVQTPSKLTISGANRSEMTRISLELTPDDSQNGNQVTIRRVFCIESTNDFKLEVIRTTNIENMDIKIYPVKASASNLKDSGIEDSGTVKGNDGISTYYYNPDSDPLSGSYLNQVADQQIAIQVGNDRTLHGENYVEGDTVQKNSEPLYWRAGATQDFDNSEYSASGTATDGTTIHYRYYVLQLSWSTEKQETDIVYLLASH